MKNRYFSSEDDTPVETVKVKAIKRGNVTGKKGVFHFDPKGKDPLARERTVPVEVAIEAKTKGLVEYVSRGTGSDRGRGTPLVDAVANRRSTSVENDGEDLRAAEYFGSSGSDTRDTTAFARDPSKFARTGVQEEQDLRPMSDAETEIEDLDDADGDDDDGDDGDGEGEANDRTGTFQTDETLLQEGNARGADAPPHDEDDTTGGDSMDADQTSSTETNQSNESQADNSAVVDATTDTAAPAAAPRPRRSRAAAVQG